MKTGKLICSILGLSGMLICTASVAEQTTGTDQSITDILFNPAGNTYLDIGDYLKQASFHGNLRAYFFLRAYSNSRTIDNHAFSLGGYAGLLTAPLYNFQLGLTLGAANSLGLNPRTPTHVDVTLPGDTIYVLSEAFAQYRNKYFFVRGPDQIIDTPWIMPSDTRMTPSSFRGVYAEISPFADYAPLKDLRLVALTVTDYNARSDGHFAATNNFIPGVNGGQPYAALAGQSAPGATAFALKYGAKGDPLIAQLWWHQFYNFSQLLWLDVAYTHKTGIGYDLLFGIQFANQTTDGTNLLKLTGQGAAADTQSYGALMGVSTPFLKLSAAYTGIIAKKDSFERGDLVSPYSAGFGTDPMYTTQQLGGGLVEKQSAGNSFKVAATSYFLDDQIKAVVSYAGYYFTPYATFIEGKSAETDVDITYSFPKSSMVDGLSIRNRLGVMTGNANFGHFYYNRFQIQYQF